MPEGKRNRGRPMKRWRDVLEEEEEIKKGVNQR
jgi:hypothetical protein